MIIDCFPFFNEIKLLLLRLEYLYDYVDRFVIVEADRTQTGISKPYHLDQWWDAIPAKYTQKIYRIRTTFKGDDGNPKRAWGREHGQRESIAKWVQNSTDLGNSDIVVVSDVDEIPHKELLIALLRTSLEEPIQLEQQLFYYNPDTRSGQWCSAFVIPAGQLSPGNINKIRLTKNMRVLERGGWHFSYHMSPELILKKFESVADQEFILTEYRNLEYVKQCIRDRQFIFKHIASEPLVSYSRDLYPRDLKNLLDLYFPYDEYNLYQQDQRPG